MKIVVKIPESWNDRVGFDLARIADMYPASVTKLENMGIDEGTLSICEGWTLTFTFPNGVKLTWITDTRQWETD